MTREPGKKGRKEGEVSEMEIELGGGERGLDLRVRSSSSRGRHDGKKEAEGGGRVEREGWKEEEESEKSRGWWFG